MAGFWSGEGDGKRRGGARACLAAAVILAAMLSDGHAQTRSDPALLDAIHRFEAALANKDVDAALAAWQFEKPGERESEEAALRGVFSAARVSVTFEASGVSSDGETAATLGNLTQITEPRGSIEQWGLLWQRGAAGWRIVSRKIFGGFDSLVHLNLQKQGFLAAGQTIELEDFTLTMTEGTFFLNTQEAGPTALVFVGKGRVSFNPRPRTERGQMKIFAKRETLDDTVSMAFLRLHPADLYRVLRPGTFVEDPESPRRFDKAREFFERHKADAFVLDAAVAGAPWWLLPNLGDAAITFRTRRFGSLTLALSGNEAEGINLFDRGRQRQISVYSRTGLIQLDTDGESALDVVNHDLALSLNPSTFDLAGRDTVAIDVKAPVTSLRFHLDDELQVKSVRSAEGGGHLFFRVRGQNSVLVSMGSLAGKVGRMNLTVDYVGRLPAGTVESEILQGGRAAREEEAPPFALDPAFIYSKRRAFYPQLGDEDYATSRLSVTVPAEWGVVAGGKKSERVEGSTRIVIHEQTEVAKYIAFLVARIVPIAAEQAEGLSFEAYGQSRTRRDGMRTVDALKTATRFYSSLFGPLPYSPLNLVLIEAMVPGGHSPAGLIMLQQRPPLVGGTLRDDPATFYDIPGFFLAHELAHQWWGQGVTPRSYRDRWISEGFAQYAAALWVKESQGDAMFERVLKKMAGWARRLGASGPVDLGTRVGHVRNDPQAYRAVVYDKGALVLDMTRRLIGDDAFRRSLLKLQREHRFKSVDSETVRRAFEAEGGIDLDPLWETFVRNTEIPSARVEAGHGIAEIVLTGYIGPLPLTVEVDGKRLQVVVRGRTPIPGAGAGSKITLDPSGTSLVKVNR